MGGYTSQYVICRATLERSGTYTQTVRRMRYENTVARSLSLSLSFGRAISLSRALIEMEGRQRIFEWIQNVMDGVLFRLRARARARVRVCVCMCVHAFSVAMRHCAHHAADSD